MCLPKNKFCYKLGYNDHGYNEQKHLDVLVPNDTLGAIQIIRDTLRGGRGGGVRESVT